VFRRGAVAILLICFGLIQFSGCAMPVDSRVDAQLEEAKELPGYNDGEWFKMTLYFRNLDHEPGVSDSEPLIPVTRYVPQTDATARAILTALLRGPLPNEEHQYRVGPVIDTAVLIEDIYIKDRLCVIHWQCDDPLFPAQTGYLAESLLVQSLVQSLTSHPQIDAVWLFRNNSPWQGAEHYWLTPLNKAGGTLVYTLYFNDLTALKPENMHWEQGRLQPVRISLSDPVGEALENLAFYQIIDLLKLNYGQNCGAVFPADNRVLSFSLEDGLLAIDLAGSTFTGQRSALLMVRSLVYTFTELPEIDRVIVTLEGEPWTGGNFVWKKPLRRENLPYMFYGEERP